MNQTSELLKIDYSDLLYKEFAWGGRGPAVYDCYGLVKEVYKRLEIELPEYKSERDPNLIQMAIFEGKKLFREIKEPKPFCIVTFFIRPYITSHIGVVLEDTKRFIHIMAKSRVTVERIDSLTWKNRITGLLEWRG